MTLFKKINKPIINVYKNPQYIFTTVVIFVHFNFALSLSLSLSLLKLYKSVKLLIQLNWRLINFIQKKI